MNATTKTQTLFTWSFAIATYNRADMLREAVRRAVTQTEDQYQ